MSGLSSPSHPFCLDHLSFEQSEICPYSLPIPKPSEEKRNGELGDGFIRWSTFHTGLRTWAWVPNTLVGSFMALVLPEALKANPVPWQMVILKRQGAICHSQQEITDPLPRLDFPFFTEVNRVESFVHTMLEEAPLTAVGAVIELALWHACFQYQCPVGIYPELKHSPLEGDSLGLSKYFTRVRKLKTTNKQTATKNKTKSLSLKSLQVLKIYKIHKALPPGYISSSICYGEKTLTS